MSNPGKVDYILGLDLGTSSIGWSLVGLSEAGQPSSVLRSGVRIFEEGVEGNIEQGKEVSKNLTRR
ncbi:MAG: hypothetical protein JRD68_15305, partial [Deltaproteobacteria bacterium]|nr:hypothetical protein [Deltaproteobacteria bacterium]